MHLLVPLLLVLGQLPAAAPQQAETVYRCDFDGDLDLNFDEWPDEWTRLRSPQHPSYLPIAIADDSHVASKPCSQCLRVDLDGGSAAVFTPPIPFSANFSLIFEGRVRTERLKNNRVYYSLTLQDDQGGREVHTSASVQSADDWTLLRIGPITPSHAAVRQLILGLHVEAGTPADLVGTVFFDDLWVGRLPRMQLRTNRDTSLFADPGEITVTCEVSGITYDHPRVTFELLDVHNHLLSSEQVPVSIGDEGGGDHGPTDGIHGTAVWNPDVPDYGFYRVRASLHEADRPSLERIVHLAVLRPNGPPESGEFGWSLPRGDDPIPFNLLPALLGQVGINWVKFPIWQSPQQPADLDRLAWLADRLSSQGIEMVGMLDQPPPATSETPGQHEPTWIANVFMDPLVWQPILDPIMIRLSLKVRWWQLGGDADWSFVEYPALAAKIREIKAHVEQFGQKTRLGLAWRWLNEVPSGDPPPWDFLACGSDPPLTAAELRSALGGPAANGTPNWVTLDPLPRSEYDLETRVRDLVERMLAAKIGGATGVFVPQPFDDESGLMTRDGMPGELLLPWRITAQLLAGAEYLGSLPLPGGSTNHVFARQDEAVVVAWNPRPTTESLFLGTDVRQVDVWGKTVRPSIASVDERERQEFAIGTMPTFLTGTNLPLARWRLGLQFDTTQLASLFGREQAATFRFVNTFDRGVSGRLRIITPDTWQTPEQDFSFRLAEGEEFADDLRVRLQADANSGPRQIVLQFDVLADRRYQFDVHRTLQVGLEDIVVELTTRVHDDGRLRVELQLTNNTDEEVSFNCLLFAPGRRRLRHQVMELAKGTAIHQFALPDGEQLVGQKIWLRAEEIGGARLLNYRITAER